jgi:hypothetical protein
MFSLGITVNDCSSEEVTCHNFHGVEKASAGNLKFSVGI